MKWSQYGPWFSARVYNYLLFYLIIHIYYIIILLPNIYYYDYHNIIFYDPLMPALFKLHPGRYTVGQEVT